MHNRITEVTANGIGAVFGSDRLQLLADEVDCFVPADFLPVVNDASNRLAQTLRVNMKLRQHRRFGAHAAATKRVAFVRRYLYCAVVVCRTASVVLFTGSNGYLQSAHCFAEVTDAEMGFFGHRQYRWLQLDDQALRA